MLMNEETKAEVCKRFHLNHGQFFATHAKKNLYWHLNDQEFGFGDLREDDIFLISCLIEPGEVFKGYNEHHMTPFMQRENPVIIINSVEVKYPERVAISHETWQKIRTNY